jgi:aminopeptidase-like protein
MPMISISRYPYPEYHTSDDNPGIITEERLAETKELILKIIDIMDRDYIPQRTFKGPIFLSRYDLWVDWRVDPELNNNLELIMLSLEGNESIFDIAEKLDMDFDAVYHYINKLLNKGLVVKRSQC